jgi:hypothetical protein
MVEKYGLRRRRTAIFEGRLIREFQRKAHHYPATVPDLDDTLEWLALMRHHGALISGLAWWERSVNLGSVLTRRGSAARCRRPDRRHRPTAGPRDHLPNGARAMTAQQNDPEVRGRTRFISIARVRRAAQLLRAERHRRDARRHDPGLTRGAADGGLATGAGRELGSLAGERWFDKCSTVSRSTSSRAQRHPLRGPFRRPARRQPGH